MEQVREVLRYHHAYRTEQTCCQWIMRFIQTPIGQPGAVPAINKKPRPRDEDGVRAAIMLDMDA